MVSVLLPFLIFLIGSSMAFLSNDVKYSRNRMSRNHEQQQQQQHRSLRNLIGKLFDTETNTIYNLDGQKHQGTSLNTGTSVGSMVAGPSTRFLEDVACLEACFKCVDDDTLTARKKRAADNCGPMCDCADSCSRMSIEQIDKIYGQGQSTRGDKTCFWKTYIQSLNHQSPSLQ